MAFVDLTGLGAQREEEDACGNEGQQCSSVGRVAGPCLVKALLELARLLQSHRLPAQACGMNQSKEISAPPFEQSLRRIQPAFP